MTPLTALDLARIKVQRLGDTKHSFVCPSCGGLAWAGRAHMQCTKKECKHRVFSPLDVLNIVWRKSYVECEELAAPIIGRQPNIAAAQARKSERLVMDAWLNLCRMPRTALESMMSSQFSKSKAEASNLGCSAVIIDAPKLKAFLNIASDTGATIPDHLMSDPPSTSLAYCVQSIPHTIDRIVVVTGRSTSSIVWKKRRAGFCGLIDTNPGFVQFLTASKLDAMKLQYTLRKMGHIPHIVSAFNDMQAEFTEGGWLPDEIPMTAVMARSTDIVELQKTIDQFPGMEDSLYATTESALTSFVPCSDTTKWDRIRLNLLLMYNAGSSKRVDPQCALLFEQTGSRPDDAAYLVDAFTRSGRLELAADMRRLAENHVIFQDNTGTVRETYNSYRMFTKHGAVDIANFSLRLQSSVIFGDVNSEVFYQGTVGHGSKKTTALISRSALESVKHLQQELQVVAAGGDGVIPTVIEVGHMRGKVMPYLAAQAARVPVIRGISFLGWSPDRRLFQTAGMEISLDGAKKTKPVFHPANQQLRPFSEPVMWSAACPEVIPDAQTLIAMMLALTARSYKRCTTRPIKVVQSSDAITLLQGVMQAMGQSNILELNANARDVRMQHNSNGVVGYPCVAAGFSNHQINQSTAAYTILTDEGFNVTDQVTMQDAENAGRAAQFALTRVVEWCIATQADDFKEIPSTDWHNSLMREGQWLMQNVCNLQPWEVRIKEVSDLEQVFHQIPLETIHARMVILNGTTLRVDCSGLEINVDGVIRECGGIGVECALKDKALHFPAAPIITAIHRFYGCDPGIKAVLA